MHHPIFKSLVLSGFEAAALIGLLHHFILGLFAATS